MSDKWKKNHKYVKEHFFYVEKGQSSSINIGFIYLADPAKPGISAWGCSKEYVEGFRATVL